MVLNRLHNRGIDRKEGHITQRMDEAHTTDDMEAHITDSIVADWTFFGKNYHEYKYSTSTHISEKNCMTQQ